VPRCSLLLGGACAVLGLLSTSNHWSFALGLSSQIEKENGSRSGGQGALSEPGFQPKWEILRYRGGHIKPLEVDGRPGFVIEPLKADKQRRWLWIAPSWLAVGRWDTAFQKIVDSPDVDHILYIQGALAKGFHVAGVDIGVSCGNRTGVAVFQDFYEVLVQRYHLNPHARMIGQSNGGLMVYSYAAAHPESVDRILGIYPATDLRSWPGLAKATGTETWMTPPPYNLSLAQMEAELSELNPIDRLAPLAAHAITILHVHGDQDRTVPLQPNSVELMQRYRALGGACELDVVKGKGHGPDPAFYESEHALRFLLE
jgi:pimeloyl-ACP methyl ester carboxylesterase